MSRYLLGIDAGNTVVKAVLFDLDGNMLARAALEGQSRKPHPGHVERDIAELWRNAGAAIRECLDKAGANGADIAAVGTAGHGNGLYLLDENGQPLVGIQSIDNRAAALAGTLRNSDLGDAVYPLCLQRPWPAQTATLLLWIKQNRPEIYRRAATAMLGKDVLTFMLTGQRVSDFSDMSGSGLLRLPERRYDDGLLDVYGLGDARHMLPPLVESDAVAGTVSPAAAQASGLAVGTPVAAGFFDVIASMIGSGAHDPGEAAIVAGTWGINQVVRDAPLVDDRIFHASTWRPDRYVAIESSATSAVNLEWFVHEFGAGHGTAAFEACNELVASVELNPDLPLFHPFLYGSATHADARGGFFGLAGWHGKAEMLYALYEGVVFEHRRHIERLRSAGAVFDKASLSGGGSRSAVWCQMFADIIGVPVTVAECQETGALGAAIAAGVAGGIFPSFETGIARMVRTRSHYQPRASNKSLTDARYRLYCELAGEMPEKWRRYRQEIDAA
ncbi:L-xylulokinase [Mesorhizobium albiziae]|uniref:L-xylulokinase n=1 Tax=Neomesorhizobium albiziae TaxID=335020 RepID=A0A1I4AHX6_9HYPH|nr:FGGY-family carbohydrate kinase [Mesorhizobium albiziae]GLS32886.1 carbohydrate kinase [Mesorhizobium albiziae]SFK56065.1 L-xylulokinase [Mesorhizobium albiziae]